MTTNWARDAIFYHIYPLGLCGAPYLNNFNAAVTHRLDVLIPWVDHIQSLGVNAVYLGPVFQSSSHGYDTADYYHVDQRLGDQETLTRFSEALHEHGIRLVLDAVFNHVGRDFWAFQDVLKFGKDSAYIDWFANLDFKGQSPLGDPFQYESWEGHYSLVKLNLSNPNVRAHLLDAVGMWMDTFGIDGLRLDAADCVDLDFMRALHNFTKKRDPDFWLMGEVVHGDYRQWANPQILDSVTNYESYKGLYSSLNDTNYHEIAYSLTRQFGLEGLYKELSLYNFVDNHDVSRIASQLKNPTHLYPLHILLFTMPGVPSIYYGSEWGIEGKKNEGSDAPLRPALYLHEMQLKAPHPNLVPVIQRLSRLRQQMRVLRYGDFQAVHTANQQMVFLRQAGGEKVMVGVNSSHKPAVLDFAVPWTASRIKDVLNDQETFPLHDGRLKISLPPTWGRVLIPA
jgi:glycosidase